MCRSNKYIWRKQSGNILAAVFNMYVRLSLTKWFMFEGGSFLSIFKK